ncbi:hypothetical protein [Curtobacterium sp. MCBD17_028]|uniref:hypothetical protein n=1 Tax=Curtobacterium sp. MCBD17_028 TaxID=2175670 RepID=UPI000DA7F8A5|nr:hypothetical protein [Curtobacterium sp. MCBD17_028]PZE24755.1 hypothetical protein DEI86_12015 [Curtobacterium sp. MCBD17_028]
MSHVLPTSPKRVRFTWFAIGTGVLAAVLLAFSMSGTLSGFVASITNSGDTAVTGTLVMQESTTGANAATCTSTDGGSVSTNTATCTSIDQFGGAAMVPGDTVTTAMTITNTGSAAARTFTLTPGSCGQLANGSVNGTANDLCSQMTVVVKNTTANTTVFSGTLAALGSTTTPFSLPAVPGGSSTAFSFAVSLPSTLGNSYQGLQATVPLTWSYAS